MPRQPQTNPTIFTSIISGDSPARFVWKDDVCVAFLTIEPRSPGHTLVVPRQEVDRWLDVEADTMEHLMRVARMIGLAQREEWRSDRVGLMIEGYMVPHLHIHVWPSWSPLEFHPAGINRAADPAELDENAVRLRRRLRADGEHSRSTGPTVSPTRPHPVEEQQTRIHPVDRC